MLSALPYPIVRFSGPCWEVHGASPAARDQLGATHAEMSAAVRLALEPYASKIVSEVWVGRGVLVLPWRRHGVVGDATLAGQPDGSWLLCLPSAPVPRVGESENGALQGEPLLSLLRLLPVPMWWAHRDDKVGHNNYVRDLPRCQMPGSTHVSCTEAVIRAAGCGLRTGQQLPAHRSFHQAPGREVTATSHTVDLERCGRWQVLTHYPTSGSVAVVTMAFDEQRAQNSLAAAQAARQVVAELSESQQDGREEVRAEVAREVHDNLGQELTVLRLALRDFKNVLATDDEQCTGRWRPHLDRLSRQTDVIMDTARRIAYEQRVDILTQKGLSEAAAEYVLQVEARTGLRCSLEIAPGWVAPDLRMSRHLYRSIQELLNNVVKHAGAQRAGVQLAFAGNCYLLEVRDDGKGFELGAVDARGASHIGLRSLRERAAVYGGELSVVSRPTVEGCAVRLYLPERRKARRDADSVFKLDRRSAS